MTKRSVPDCAAQGAKDAIGIVVGPVDVERLAVAAERDRAGPLPRAEVQAS
jgi:hypothetical protein